MGCHAKTDFFDLNSFNFLLWSLENQQPAATAHFIGFEGSG